MYFEASSLPTLPFGPIRDGSAHGMPMLEMKVAV
jgi:hypothetical protein